MDPHSATFPRAGIAFIESPLSALHRRAAANRAAPATVRPKHGRRHALQHRRPQLGHAAMMRIPLAGRVALGEPSAAVVVPDGIRVVCHARGILATLPVPGSVVLRPACLRCLVAVFRRGSCRRAAGLAATRRNHHPAGLWSRALQCGHCECAAADDHGSFTEEAEARALARRATSADGYFMRVFEPAASVDQGRLAKRLQDPVLELALVEALGRLRLNGHAHLSS